MRRRNGTKTMALKIDLYKAYDSLRWEFIKDTLWDANFPTKFIKLLMFPIKFVSI